MIGIVKFTQRGSSSGICNFNALFFRVLQGNLRKLCRQASCLIQNPGKIEAAVYASCIVIAKAVFTQNPVKDLRRGFAFCDFHHDRLNEITLADGEFFYGDCHVRLFRLFRIFQLLNSVFKLFQSCHRLFCHILFLCIRQRFIGLARRLHCCFILKCQRVCRRQAVDLLCYGVRRRLIGRLLFKGFQLRLRRCQNAVIRHIALLLLCQRVICVPGCFNSLPVLQGHGSDLINQIYNCLRFLRLFTAHNVGHIIDIVFSCRESLPGRYGQKGLLRSHFIYGAALRMGETAAFDSVLICRGENIRAPGRKSTVIIRGGDAQHQQRQDYLVVGFYRTVVAHVNIALQVVQRFIDSRLHILPVCISGQGLQGHGRHIYGACSGHRFGKHKASVICLEG